MNRTGGRGSLQRRLLLASLIVLLLFMLLTGAALEQAFRQSAEAAAHQNLRSRLFTLLAVIDVDEKGTLRFARPLPDPRFHRPGSGLYARVTDGAGIPLLQSRSLLGIALPPLPPAPVGQERFAHVPLEGRPHLALHYGLRWELENGDNLRLNLHLLEDLQPHLAQLADYRRTLWSWLGGAALLLLLTQAAILRWGLSPLRRVVRRLARIERGEQTRLGDDWPGELHQLTGKIDDLLAHNREQLQRYRDALGNMAHSLKTPLAILANHPALQSADDAQEAIVRLREIVDHQLQRAATAGRAGQTPVPLRPVLERLLRTLAKVHADKAVAAVVDLPADLRVRCDEGDLLELFGNLLDNAFKWCRSRVRIGVLATDPQSVTLIVDDDGPGIPAAERTAVLQRGRRADTQTEGHGIGLAMVQEMVLIYGGELHIDDNDWGGARLRLRLPA